MDRFLLVVAPPNGKPVKAPDNLVSLASLAIALVFTGLALMALLSLAVAGSFAALFALFATCIGLLAIWSTGSDLFRKLTPEQKAAAEKQREEMYQGTDLSWGIFGILVSGIFFAVCVYGAIRAGRSFFTALPLVGALVSGVMMFRVAQGLVRIRHRGFEASSAIQEPAIQRILRIFARLLFFAGFLGFISGALFASGLFNRLPRTVALPLGELEGIAVDAKGQIYCGAQFYSRIQVYDASGRFLRGWFLEAGGGVFSVGIDEKGLVEIYTARGAWHYLYTTTGDLVLAEHYDRRSTSAWAHKSSMSRDRNGAVYEIRHGTIYPSVVRIAPNGSETTVIQLPWYLWPVTGAAPAWLSGAVGMLLTIYFERKRKKQKVAVCLPAG